MAERLFRSVLDLVIATANVVHPVCEREPDLAEPVMVTGRLKQRHRGQGKPFLLIGRCFGQVGSVVRRQRLGERRGGRVSLGSRSLGDLVKQRSRSVLIVKGAREIDQEVSRGLVAQGGGAFKERASSSWVNPPDRSAPGIPEPLGSLTGELRVGVAEVHEVTGRLLKMVAADLLELDETLAVRFEPGSEASMQLRPG